jgi:hypothetical protein
VTGNSGLILKTTNGGIAWTIYWWEDNSNLHSVFFQDHQNGYVVGDGGLILQTIDGGLTWWPQRSGTGWNLHGVCVTGAYTGFTAGEKGTILKTTGIGVHAPLLPIAGNVTVWPNPARDRITIDVTDFSGQPCSVEITGVNGNLIHSVVSDGQPVIVHVADFPPGLYFVTLSRLGRVRCGTFIRL